VYRTFRFVGIEGKIGQNVPSVDKRSRSQRPCDAATVHEVLAVYAQANLLQIKQGIWA